LLLHLVPARRGIACALLGRPNESEVHANGAHSDKDGATSRYDKLEQAVLPLYYDNRPGWIAVMKGAIAKNAPCFNSHRMLRRYTSDAYVR
jgi:glucan phosphorylase